MVGAGARLGLLAVLAGGAAAAAGAAAGAATGRRGARDRPGGLAGAVGHTPLVELPSLSRATGRKIWAKCEHLNATNSVKDRAALGMLRAAEEAGRLGGEGGARGIIEATGGNTGIALAQHCAARGYGVTIVVPSNVSTEKIDQMRTFGAEVVLVPGGVPFADPRHYFPTAQRLAGERGLVFLNQFDNDANFRAHFEGTGPEIWQQMEGKLDAFVAAAGTGGTFAGISSFLKERRESVRCVLADCPGSGLKAYVETGEFHGSGEGTLQGGIGISRLTQNFAKAKADAAVFVSDAEALAMAFHLLRHEGLFVGPSAALNVVAAVKVARDLPEGAAVVTVLCDSGERYAKKVYTKRWRAREEAAAAKRGADDALAFLAPPPGAAKD